MKEQLEKHAWVRWIAQDRSGAWWGFEAEPNQGDVSWYENEVGRYVHLGQEGENPDWTHSLQSVPMDQTLKS